MNKSEDLIKKKYQKDGYNCLHNKGFPDFIFYKVIDNEPVDIKFIEVKTKGSELSYDQKIFRRITEKLGLSYKIEIVDNAYQTNPDQTIPNPTTPEQPTPVQSEPNHPKPNQSRTDHSRPGPSSPNQTVSNQTNSKN